MFKTQFDAYVVVGDSISCSVDGIDYTAKLEFDDTSRPEDSDCYTKPQIEKWRNDEWFFGGIVISAECNGILLDDHLVGLWGIDCNFPSRRKNPNKYLLEIANELLNEAIPLAIAAKQDIIDNLLACKKD